MRPLWIFGGSSYAEIAVHYFNRDTDFEVVGLVLDEGYHPSARLSGYPVRYLGGADLAPWPVGDYFHVAITYASLNRLRRRKCEELQALGLRPASYISPHAYVDDTAILGDHLFIFEDNTIQPFVQIGSGAILWSGNHVGHHSDIGEYVFVSSHVVISGHCHIGAGSFLGVNSTVGNNVSIGDENWILPNAFISRDTGADEIWKPSRSELSATPASERHL